MRNNLVLGGTGFVGQHVCEALQRTHCRFTVPTRNIKRASHVAHLPLATVVDIDIQRPDALARLVAGHDAVVNLVAILHGPGPPLRPFRNLGMGYRHASHPLVHRNLLDARPRTGPSRPPPTRPG